jgi:CBS domain containing-hemolysin-like protein
MDGLLLTAVLPLAAFVLLTAGNALFVVAEFGLVTVDRVEIGQRADRGERRARTVREALHELSFQLSGAQLGITITALLTGYLAEPALSRLFTPMVQPLAGGATGTVTHALALILATLVSMLFGELVPKNAALARPMRAALATAGPLRAFSTLFRWLIGALNGSANWLVRRLGIEPQEELASARSPEELGLLAAISARAGALPTETATLLRRTIRFGEKRAAKAMTPRVDVVGLKTTASLADLIATSRETGHTRFPVYDSTLDLVTGVACVPDALGVPLERRSATPVSAIAREPVYVPESLALDKVLAALRAADADLAIVVDEYGGTDGVVTVEDLIEELVGEISDEHDPEGTDQLRRGADAWTVPGSLHVQEVERLVDLDLPEGDYQTVGGLIINELGRLPERDDVVTLVLPRLLDDDGTVDELLLTVRSVDHRVPSTVEVRRRTAQDVAS